MDTREDVSIVPRDSLREDNEQESPRETEEYVEIEGIGGSACCHPQRVPHKAIVLFLMCMLGFGSYYCYDNPGALQDQLRKEIPMTTFEFASLYSWYSWPNVVLPIIGGYLIDAVFGIRLGAFLFAGFIFLGQLIFAFGAFMDSILTMQASRFIFGIGGESLAVAQNTYASAWFKGSALNTVFGFQLSVSRFGSSVNYWTVGRIFDSISSPEIPGYTALGWTLLIASFTCILSFVCSAILGFLDKRAARLLNKENLEQDKISLKDILQFKANFWILSIVCVTYYAAIFPFISLGQVFFIKKYDMNNDDANFITGLVYLISAFASPVLGLLIDTFGRNLSFVLLAVVTTLFAHVLLAFTLVNPYIPISIMGLSYSLLASALWPICTLIIPENQLGTAYGLMQAFQNLGLAVVPLGAGIIVDKYGYVWLEVYFICFMSIALVSTLAMWLIDLNSNHSFLNMSIKERQSFTRITRSSNANEDQ